ncbi:MAG TPA: hypothetical protein VFG52_05950, partial [Xanthomonadales bacterium]|nr:hypothetical protein [Xanthomonadales bacterium]
MPRIRAKKNWPAGRVVHFTHRSRVLADNPWDDPCDRQLPVYLPPDYSEQAQPYMTLWDLAA